METVCTILSVIDQTKLAGAIRQAIYLPSQALLAMAQQPGGEVRQDICKALSVFTGSFRAINDLP